MHPTKRSRHQPQVEAKEEEEKGQGKEHEVAWDEVETLVSATIQKASQQRHAKIKTSLDVQTPGPLSTIMSFLQVYDHDQLRQASTFQRAMLDNKIIGSVPVIETLVLDCRSQTKFGTPGAESDAVRLLLDRVQGVLAKTQGLVVYEIPNLLTSAATGHLLQVLLDPSRKIPLRSLCIAKRDPYQPESGKRPDPVVLDLVTSTWNNPSTSRLTRLDYDVDITHEIRCWATLEHLRLPALGNNQTFWPFLHWPSSSSVLPLRSLDLGDDFCFVRNPIYQEEPLRHLEAEFWHLLTTTAPHLTSLRVGPMDPCASEVTSEAFFKWCSAQTDKLETLGFHDQDLFPRTNQRGRDESDVHATWNDVVENVRSVLAGRKYDDARNTTLFDEVVSKVVKFDPALVRAVLDRNILPNDKWDAIVRRYATFYKGIVGCRRLRVLEFDWSLAVDRLPVQLFTSLPRLQSLRTLHGMNIDQGIDICKAAVANPHLRILRFGLAQKFTLGYLHRHLDMSDVFCQLYRQCALVPGYFREYNSEILAKLSQ